MDMYLSSSNTSSSASASSSSTKVLPLTKENLALMTQSEPSAARMARYCNDLASISSSISLPPPRHARERCQSSTSIDRVMASPRLLPFPYHNDSMFLPTAETIYHPYPSRHPHSNASVHRAPLYSPSISSFTSASITTATSIHRRASAVDRRTLPAIPPRRQASAPPFEKAKRLVSKQRPSSSKCSEIAREFPADGRRNWLWRVWKFVCKRKNNTKSSCRMAEAPVWYSQYASNPSPPPGMAMVAA
ncbi:hypothetical protein EC973_000263 [Apophysomyces ossiformis]|uniref:Uncharacterized protein n=1 Tax=Apophysomyces ossiformis TaxID=679940 RepID=A0A8H7EU60_9FUNG|nr:hypothetical protein EC973_000263 [Apophysomyces ossiformis]